MFERAIQFFDRASHIESDKVRGFFSFLNTWTNFDVTFAQSNFLYIYMFVNSIVFLWSMPFLLIGLFFCCVRLWWCSGGMETARCVLLPTYRYLWPGQSCVWAYSSWASKQYGMYVIELFCMLFPRLPGVSSTGRTWMWFGECVSDLLHIQFFILVVSDYNSFIRFEISHSNLPRYAFRW